ncbi:hypothetical protein [Kistimonas asteriae]|uniref:hypothetical protein n=1 Tax=Kistimonas asteriae TaxID=517724 RepID=UPI001BA47EA2|nr:hypothetical protein [Kistimonas asteriae]
MIYCIPCCFGNMASVGFDGSERQPTFCKKTVLVLKDVSTFLVGLSCIFVCIRNAIFEYKCNAPDDERADGKTLFFSTLRAFLYPAPGLGAFVYCMSRIIHRVNPDSPLGVPAAKECKEVVVLIPIIGPAIHNVLLNYAS